MVRDVMAVVSFLRISVMALLLASCATATCPHGSTLMTSDSLFFGGPTPPGAVTEEEWAGFVDRVVAPRLPEGFTVIASRG